MKDLIDLQGLFNCSRPDYPEGHGAFDPDQLLERTEDIKDDPCEYCAMYNKSDCCGAEIKWTDICTSCGEHCDIACNNCDLK
jgi:hypothetical protein